MIGVELVFVGGRLELDEVGLDRFGRSRRIARVCWSIRCCETGGRDFWTNLGTLERGEDDMFVASSTYKSLGDGEVIWGTRFKMLRGIPRFLSWVGFLRCDPSPIAPRFR